MEVTKQVATALSNAADQVKEDAETPDLANEEGDEQLPEGSVSESESPEGDAAAADGDTNGVNNNNDDEDPAEAEGSALPAASDAVAEAKSTGNIAEGSGGAPTPVRKYVYKVENLEDVKKGDRVGDILSYAEVDEVNEAGDPTKDAKPTTWGLDEDLWYYSSAELDESNILPDTRVLNEDGDYEGVNFAAVNDVKRELMAGHAVSMAFCADTSRPGETGEAQYVKVNENGTWSHWTYQEEGINHGVTIVGWDDTYSRDNFVTMKDETGRDTGKRPEHDGAWIVKNSWGSESDEFTGEDADLQNALNKGSWGTKDENGKHTGYFYLSYCDRTIQALETFEFDVSDEAMPESEKEYNVDQYDYLTAAQTLEQESSTPAPMVNVFTASSDQVVRTMSCETTKPNTEVTYELYLLEGDAPENTKDSMTNEELGLAGEPIRTVKATYDFGGYHRAILDEKDWVPMREGQRYAVKVTQKVGEGSDAKYYRSVSQNIGEFSPEAIKKQEGAYRALYEFVIKQQLYDQKHAELIKKIADENHDGDESKLTDDERKQADQDAQKWAEDEFAKQEYKDALELYVNQAVASLKTTHCVGVVNAGESYTTSADGSSLVDWSGVVAELEKKAKEGDVPWVYDNFPIKTVAEIADYASVDQLNKLLDLVNRAEALLSSYAVSADGSDVSVGTKWTTQEQHDALAAAIKSARDMLAKAGDDFSKVTTETPSEADVKAATEQLQAAYDTAEKQAKEGTKLNPDPDPNSAADPSVLPTTGDNLLLPLVIAIVVVCAAAAVAVAAVRARRR